MGKSLLNKQVHRNIALQHNRFMAEASEKEPEVVLIGDTHIQRLAQHEVCGLYTLSENICLLTTFSGTLLFICCMFCFSDCLCTGLKNTGNSFFCG